MEDNESSDLQNVTFDKFGSVIERNGYYPLNTILTPNASATCQGLYWYTSLVDTTAIMVNTGLLCKMDNLDGTWDNISGVLSLKTAGVDTYTVALLKCDGTEAATTFTDDTGKTVTNTDTYDSYTVLMLHMEGNLTDSARGKTVTNSGTAFSSTYKFGSSSTSFSTALLSLADSADWAFGTGDLTIDFWVRFASISIEQVPISQWWDSLGDVSFRLILEADNSLHFYYSTDGTVLTDVNFGGFSVAINTWYHIAIVRNGTDFKAYINGVQIGSTHNIGTNSLYNSTRVLTIGARNGTSQEQFLNGMIDELRVSKGIARWTSNFTPPISPYGQSAVSTSVYKFATGSGVMYGSGEHLEIATSTDFSFGTNDFTIDSWIYPTKTNTAYLSMEDTYSGTAGFAIFSTGTATTLYYNSGAASSVTSLATTALNLNAWNHLALIKSTNNYYVAINGILSSSSVASGTSTGFANKFLRIGYAVHSSTSYYFDGYTDEFRVSKGIARWGSNFTPPTVPSGDYIPIDFDTFLGTMIATGKDLTPFSWVSGNLTASAMTVVTGLTGAKFIKKFQNYCFLGNVRVGGVRYPSRVYWSAIRSISSWDSADWMEISKDDGDEITSLRVLGDRLVVYKNNSIYVILFTGDVDIPFVVQKTNSSVGCVAPYSIQEIENGHCFVSQDGVYYFDGYNSYKMSDRIADTFSGINVNKLEGIVSLHQRKKNLYWLACPSGTSLYNNMMLTWNSYLNAWSVYTGMSASAMAIFMINGTEERPYFSDYNGYTYREDFGTNDYPLNTLTAISAYYYTNWKAYDDICDKKGIGHVYIVHKNESSTNLTFGYSYDFYNGLQYSSTFSLYTTQTVTALTTRRDLTGRGNFVRLYFANSGTTSSFRLDGLGTYVSRESKT